ncbi:SpaH/EbpB family LPXTG-anchored major pilin [Corynebacterium rouxii]|uniref:SpaH/EbpB family LPXTG-anchored major pilin n=1 Tax=Corynebacterium rouxii TaxID=2719119 RepID=UPI00313D700C
MNKFSRTARSVTFAAIVGLSLGVSAPGAFAQDGEISAVNKTAGDSPLVNKEAKGKLTIHKYANPIKLGDASGTATDAHEDRGTAVNGIGFSVYKILQDPQSKEPIDVTTNEGLLAASKLQATSFDASRLEDLVGQGVLKAAVKGETADNGTWVVSETMELGAYLVVETDSVGTPVGGKEEVTYEGAVPFIAFIPMTENNAKPNQGVKWNYDVHAFPKNYNQEKPTKTVVDKDQNAGDEALKYTINAPVGAIQPDKKRTQFKVTDKIDEKLTIIDVTAKIQKADGSSTPLNAGGNAKGEKFWEGQDVTVDLTEETAAALKQGDKIVVEITTKLVAKFANAKGDYDIAPNTARVFQNKPDGEEDVQGTPSNTPKTYWGGLKFKKVDSGRVGLAGAKFQIVRQENSEQCSQIDTKKANSWKPVSGQQNGKVGTEFTSDGDGTVLITGLHVNDFADNADVVPASHYCLIETAAPAGKELLPEALEFKLVATETKPDRVYKLASVQVGEFKGEVVNTDDNTPKLPMTGGAGVGILAAIGAAIIGAGAWFARRNSAEA